MKQSQIHEAVALIAPINGIVFPVHDDKSTWQIQFKETATPQQVQDATDYINSNEVFLN